MHSQCDHAQVLPAAQMLHNFALGTTSARDRKSDHLIGALEIDADWFLS